MKSCSPIAVLATPIQADVIVTVVTGPPVDEKIETSQHILVYQSHDNYLTGPLVQKVDSFPGFTSWSWSFPFHRCYVVTLTLAEGTKVKQLKNCDQKVFFACF